MKKFFLDEKSYSRSSESYNLSVIPVVFYMNRQFTVGHHSDIWIEGALYLQVCCSNIFHIHNFHNMLSFLISPIFPLQEASKILAEKGDVDSAKSFLDQVTNSGRVRI